MSDHRPVCVVTDSTADVPHDLSHKLGITVVPLTVSFGSQHYRDGVDLSGEQFYARLATTKAMPVTAAPSPGAFSVVYQQLTAGGNDVISIHVSSDLSAVYNAAMLAASDYSGEDGGPRVVVVDSRALSMCTGWLAIDAARAAQAGQSLAAISALVRDMVPRLRILGAFDTLEMLQRGGRIGMAGAFLGTMLSVKPLLHLKEGHVEPLERVRTSSKALARIVEIVRDFGPLESLCVLHGYNEEAAAKLHSMLAPYCPADKVLLAHIGAVLGTHIGPKAVGVACVLQRG